MANFRMFMIFLWITGNIIYKNIPETVQEFVTNKFQKLVMFVQAFGLNNR